jgi:hypothetical protein
MIGSRPLRILDGSSIPFLLPFISPSAIIFIISSVVALGGFIGNWEARKKSSLSRGFPGSGIYFIG